MKKLFTLVALLAMFMGAKAEWVEDYKIDYSTKTNFPFYVMGYVPEWIDGVMTDFGSNYRYETQENLDGDGDGKWKDGESSEGTAMAGNTEYQKVTGAGPYWHQYFIADGIPTELDGAYTVKAMVKASEACTINVNMGWGWGSGQQKSADVTIGTEWAEVEWEYTEIGGTSCNLVAQPGTVAATIEWKWVTVSHNAKAEKPVVWQEWLTNDGKSILPEVEHDNKWMGDAETPWGDLANVKFNDQTQNYLICAWGKERAVNMNDDGGWDPVPATIEQEENGNHYFVVHGKEAITEGDAAAWDNQFWIQSPKEWKSGDQIKIHFRYKASKTVTVATQCHKQNPSDYLIWHAIGDINFTEEWQDFDGTMSIADDMAGTWSIAFQLNQNDKEAIDFYFDDLSWQSMKLDEGYFATGCNPNTGLEYDFDNPVQFEDQEGLFVATLGEVGKPETYVSQIMISTVSGSAAAFKSNTLKPAGSITNDPDNWLDYTASSLAKLTLPGEGVWTIYIDTEYKSMAFEMIEGNVIDPVDVVTNKTEIVVNGVERKYKSTDEAAGEGVELPEGYASSNAEDNNPWGQPWDNQFWIVANRELTKGEVTHLKFKYKASKEAKTSTQDHKNPGSYLHWGAIGDVNFTTEWQEFDADFTVPNEADGMLSIAFNMAEIREACDYEITDVQWYLKADDLEEGKTWENLIDETGSKNFYVKIGAGTNPYVFGEGSGINSVVKSKTGTAAIYNLAGQRVSNDYKGIVVKEGKKVMVK